MGSDDDSRTDRKGNHLRGFGERDGEGNRVYFGSTGTNQGVGPWRLRGNRSG